MKQVILPEKCNLQDPFLQRIDGKSKLQREALLSLEFEKHPKICQLSQNESQSPTPTPR